jgi:hypothetical protein
MLPLVSTPAFANVVEQASRVIDRWAAAYSAQDASGVVKLYTADAIVFGTARPLVFDGTGPIAAAFAGLAESANTVRICRRWSSARTPCSSPDHMSSRRSHTG